MGQMFCIPSQMASSWRRTAAVSSRGERMRAGGPLDCLVGRLPVHIMVRQDVRVHAAHGPLSHSMT